MVLLFVLYTVNLRNLLIECPNEVNKHKSVWSNVLWYVKVCIFWKCIQYTIHWDETQMLKKFPSIKIIGTKNALFFVFRRLQLITVLLLICDSYVNWSTRFVSLKLCVGFPFSIPFRFYWSLYLYSTKYMDSLTLKRHNFFQN